VTNNNQCAPPSNPNAAAFARLASDPCAALESLQGALYQLLSGQTVASVKFGDMETRFSRASIPDLRAEIRVLQATCRPKYRTVRAGPHARWTNPRNFYPGY